MDGRKAAGLRRRRSPVYRKRYGGCEQQRYGRLNLSFQRQAAR